MVLLLHREQKSSHPLEGGPRAGFLAAEHRMGLDVHREGGRRRDVEDVLLVEADDLLAGLHIMEPAHEGHGHGDHRHGQGGDFDV